MDPLRFAAEDPNLYRYVGNQSLAGLDPSGLKRPILNIYVNAGEPARPNRQDVRERGETPLDSGHFREAEVEANLQTILDNAKVNIEVNVLMTVAKPEELNLGWQYRTNGTENSITWWNPFTWVYVFNQTSNEENYWEYNHYVEFCGPDDEKNEFPAQTTGATTEVDQRELDEDQPGGAWNWTIWYANMLLHETVWLGALDNSDNTQSTDWDGPYGNPTTLYEVSEEADDINGEFEAPP